MRRSHTENRARRYRATQFVSDFETEPEGVKMRTTGTVKFFNSGKGFGFCQREDGEGDVFIHNNALKRSGIEGGLQSGEKVEFDLIEVAGKAPKAENIRRL